MTEFENKLVEIIKGYCSINENGEYTQSCLKDDSKELLDIARKEFLKDFPKWKRCVDSIDPFIADFKGEKYLYLNDYVIKISELEKLPKEE